VKIEVQNVCIPQLQTFDREDYRCSELQFCVYITEIWGGAVV